jgi:uncharacterized protein
MIYVLIALTALLASFLTFFSGFGLGTILLPVFAIYYPLPLAVALTAVVHLLNNLFKLGMVFRYVDWPLVKRFGIPSVIAAFAGAYVLRFLSGSDTTVTTYMLMGRIYTISWPGLIIGVLIVFFSFFELSKQLSALSFDQRHIISGGFLSGFFGGLSGHQGALRTAFLLRLNLDKKVFIATGVLVASLVDLVRLGVYSSFSALQSRETNYYLLLLAILSAWLGAFLGNKLFKKTSLSFFKWLVASFMFLMGTAIGLGIIA